ncbi:NAD(P)-dependent alcohol dehydrogenase [Knoellia aerolata]|uniref:NAD(P)-dependent alcohol dehydrogenase n=1 Tax=Knoellia aerolata TaxID=442954 RepID=UPI0005664F47|nr:NAD(P)-dependent alcohol dehydrogenase [Knoellia aerolata]
MRAVLQDRYGPVSRLRCGEVPVPQVAADEVLVRVHAASVHPDVWHVVTGRPAVLRLMGSGVRAPKEHVPGSDFAGVVTAVGDDVRAVSVGDDVFGESLPSMQWVNGATWAEYVAVQQERLLPMPTGLSHVEACTLPTAGIIALQSVRDNAKVAAGDHVLVNGAAGGVGSLAVQIARADGATVTAVDGPEKQDLLRTIGADHVIDHTRVDFTRGDDRYDAVIDIPGNHPFAAIRRVLAPGGKYVLVGHDQYGREGRAVLGSIPRMFGLMARSAVSDQIPKASFSSRPKLEYLRELADLASAGRLRPVIDRTFPLEDAAAALEHLASGTARGRVVLVVTR